MNLLIDGDSILYKICYTSKSLEECCKKWDNKISKIESYFVKVTNVQEYETIIYIQERGSNFRKKICKNYKSNRKKEPIPFIEDLKYYIKSEYKVVSEPGMESDDLIAIHSKGNAIAYIDKDLKQISSASLHINYDKFIHYVVSKDEALYNFYSQFIIGDTTDNIEGIKNKGKKFVEKYFQDGDYFHKTLKLYMEEYGTIDGWKKFRKNYFLLRLGNLEHLSS